MNADIIQTLTATFEANAQQTETGGNEDFALIRSKATRPSSGGAPRR